jgi:aspartate/methionine/tyrosine aminotransferase
VPQGILRVSNVSAAFRNGISNSLQFAEQLLAEEFVAVVPSEAFGTVIIRISYATSMKGWNVAWTACSASSPSACD